MVRILKLACLLALAGAARAETLRVRVLDADGEPAPNAILVVRSALVGGHVEHAEAATGTDGVAAFDRAERWWTPEARAQVPQVEVNLPLDAETSCSLLQREIPTEPLTLRLPPGRPIEIQVQRVDHPSVPDCDAVLEWTVPGVGAARRQVVGRVTATPTRILLPPLAVHQAFEVHAVGPDGSVRKTATVGSTASDAAPPVRLFLQGECLHVTARCVDEHDRPLQATRLEARWMVRDPQKPSHGSQTLALGKDGYIDAYLCAGPITERSEAGSFQDFDIVLLERDSDGAVQRLACLPCSGRGEGDLPLLRPQLQPVIELVRGRVVDGDGAPVADAWIRPQRHEERIGRPGVQRAGPPDAFTDADGSFVLLGASIGNWSHRFVVSHAQHFSRTVQLAPSRETTSLVVQLDAPVRVSGRVLAGSGIDPKDLLVRLRYTDELVSDLGHNYDHLHREIGWLTRVQADGGFALGSLRPGVARIEVESFPRPVILGTQSVTIGPQGVDGDLVFDLRSN